MTLPQQTENGVTVTARGYTAQVSGNDATVFGPFPTGPAFRGSPAFGVDLRGLGSEQLGLIAQPLTGIAVAGSDWGGGGVQPGFDSFPYRSGDGDVVKFDFAEFAFDVPVDIPAVTVDDASNFGRDVWMATGQTAPDFSAGLLSVLAGMDVVNSGDDASDGLFTHPLNAAGVQYLLVGAVPEGGFGPISGDRGQFYIDSFTATESTLVPAPAALPLLISGLAAMGIARLTRRRKAA